MRQSLCLQIFAHGIADNMEALITLTFTLADEISLHNYWYAIAYSEEM